MHEYCLVVAAVAIVINFLILTLLTLLSFSDTKLMVEECEGSV